MLTKQVIASHALSLIADCGSISRRAFDLLPYTYNKISVNLKKLVDSGYIRLHDKGKDKRYTLLLPGKTALSKYNPYRYPADFYAGNSSLIRRPVRSVTKGDAAMLMILAGYGVHPDDKPPLPAFTPPLADLDETGWMQLYCNRKAYSYGLDVEDGRMYFKRETPVNCYYDSLEVKGFFEDSDDKGLRYSRACGVLFTPNDLFRVYHSRDVAMEYRSTGENGLINRIPEMLKGYRPEQQKSVLVFGSGGFTAAEKILDQGLDPQKRKMAALNKGKRALLNPYDLGNPLFYIPVIKESIPLLHSMQYPFWRNDLARYAVKTHLDIEEQVKMDKGLFCYIYEGTRVYSGFELNLTSFYSLIKALTDKPDLDVCVGCFGWQEDFYRKILCKYLGNAAKGLQYIILADRNMDHIQEQFYEFWEEGRIEAWSSRPQ